MIPGVFDYKRPATLADALSALKGSGDDGLLLAGGHSLVPMMKLRLAQPSVVIDLSDVTDCAVSPPFCSFAPSPAERHAADLTRRCYSRQTLPVGKR